MYAKETAKRRRAFVENKPSAFLQDIARRYSAAQTLNEGESRQMYFYILNHYMPSAFHEKVFFFGTVYHILIQIRRTLFWFAILSIVSLSVQTCCRCCFYGTARIDYFLHTYLADLPAECQIQQSRQENARELSGSNILASNE